MADVMIKDGLWCAFTDVHMGITAENVSVKYGVTREDQDALALASQEKAIAAIEAGKFKTKSWGLRFPGKKGIR